MNNYRNIWFTNFTGIGNGITIAPILGLLEKCVKGIRYWHTRNEILEDIWFREMAGINRLAGTTPMDWRRFGSEYWHSITDFIYNNKIDLLVNLRNEGPKYDLSYYKFKESYLDKRVDAWELDFDSLERRIKQKNLIVDILRMFADHGVELSGYNNVWLKNSAHNKAGIGFVICASQKNKRWPLNKWNALANLIINYLNDNIIIFSGVSEAEINEAKILEEKINSDRCKIMPRENLRIVAERVSNLRCLVSSDTGLLHIGAASDVPTIGLYTNTDPTIWSPLQKGIKFISLVNENQYKCPYRKIYCGNCLDYYGECPSIANFDDTIKPEDVWSEVSKIL